MKNTRIMTFDKVSGFYPDLQGLVSQDAGFERKALQDAPLTPSGQGYTARLSNSRTDRDGDIIIPRGIVIDYYTGTLLWNHDLTSLPIGLCRDFQADDVEARGVLQFAVDYDFAEDVHALVAQRMLRGVSIGYIPRTVAHRGTAAFNEAARKYSLDVTDCQRILLSVELIEVSMVPVGCNRESLILAVASKAFSPSTVGAKALGLDDTTSQILIKFERKLLDLEAKMTTQATDVQYELIPGVLEETTEDDETQATPEAPQELQEAPETPEETKDTPETPEASEEPLKKTPLTFTVVRLGGYQVDETAVDAKAKALASGKLI